MATLTFNGKSTQVFFLVGSLLLTYGCATSLASDEDPQVNPGSGTNASSTLQPMEMRRTIDWNQADSQAAIDNAALKTMNPQFRRQASATSEMPQPAVPIFITPSTINSTAASSGVMTFSDPVILMSESGYTVILANTIVDPDLGRHSKSGCIAICDDRAQISMQARVNSASNYSKPSGK